MSLENSETALLTTPQLTAFGPAGYQVGMAGAKQLLDWIRAEKEGGGRRQEKLDMKLIERGSTNAGA